MFRRPAFINSKAKEFPEGFAWLNTDKPLSLADLQGHIVVLDFWTYCCINCMHTLPDLEWIEKKYHGRPVIVIGVHSAKFNNEQDAENIREAIGRYEISHPVIVDRNMAIWQLCGVSGWPTIAVIDPKGNVVYQQSGEGQRENLDDVIGVLLERHEKQGTLAKEPLAIKKPAAEPSRSLSYPGKLSISPAGDMLAISDSNHNRILVVGIESGKVIHKIGGDEKGLRDGSFEQARFFRPQGVLWVGDKIYVADTENQRAERSRSTIKNSEDTCRERPAGSLDPVAAGRQDSAIKFALGSCARRRLYLHRDGRPASDLGIPPPDGEDRAICRQRL